MPKCQRVDEALYFKNECIQPAVTCHVVFLSDGRAYFFGYSLTKAMEKVHIVVPEAENTTPSLNN